MQKLIKQQVINEDYEKNRMKQIKREIAIGMYVFLLGIAIVGVNTALFPFQENNVYNPILTYDGMIFFVETLVIVTWFTFLLYKTKIKQLLHITYDLILKSYDKKSKFKNLLSYLF